MTDPKICPDCGRQKAASAAEVTHGACPKWWATRDVAARTDCQNYADQTGYYALVKAAKARKEATMGLPTEKDVRTAYLGDESPTDDRGDVRVWDPMDRRLQDVFDEDWHRRDEASKKVVELGVAGLFWIGFAMGVLGGVCLVLFWKTVFAMVSSLYHLIF